MTVTIDDAGRLVVPKRIRDELGIDADVPLDIRVRDGRIEIEPLARPMARVRRGRVSVAVPAEPGGREPLTRDAVAEMMRSTRQRQR